jgi:hypothetical protein
MANQESHSKTLMPEEVPIVCYEEFEHTIRVQSLRDV